MVGYPLQHKSCTLCSTWWILSWWWWGRWWHRNISYSPCLQLLALSTKTLTHTQQIRLLPVWHSEYLLLIEWKWITMKVFIPDTFLLRRLRRRRKRRAWPCWVAEMEEQRRWKGRQGKQHTQGTFMEIHCNFCLKVLLFHFPKNVSVCYQSSFHHLLLFPCPYHRRVHAIQESKAVLRTQNASARLCNVSLFSGTAASRSSPSSSSSGSEPLISIKSILLIPLL